jgi:phage-related protein
VANRSGCLIASFPADASNREAMSRAAGGGVDENVAWRIVYHVAPDAIVILGMFAKTTRATPKRIIEDAQRRLARYYAALDER